MIIHTLDSGSELKSNKASQPVSQSVSEIPLSCGGGSLGRSVGRSVVQVGTKFRAAVNCDLSCN